MAPYGDQHRIFLQAMMCRGIVSKDEVVRLFQIAKARCNSKLTEFTKLRS